jgi:hypothetical protein
MFALAFGLLTLAASVAIAPHKAEAQAVIEIEDSNNFDQHGRIFINTWTRVGANIYVHRFGCKDSGGTCLADVTITP